MYELTDNPRTWQVYEAPHQDASVEKELVKIAGLNRYGKPNLRVVWGATAKNDKSENHHDLKYFCGYAMHTVEGYVYRQDGKERLVKSLDDVPEDAIAAPSAYRPAIGLPRWVIEKWTSPEELDAARRFRTRVAEGDIKATLREFPREGIYDTYLVIETREGKYRDVDTDALEYIKGRWKYETETSYEQQEKDRAAFIARQHKEMEKQRQEILEAGFDLRLPLEEKLRREAQLEEQQQAIDRYERESKKLHFGQAGV